jgi:translation initiation factor IF-1
VTAFDAKAGAKGTPRFLTTDPALFDARKGGSMGVKEEKVELDGEILEAFGGGMFKIAFENGHEAIGYTSGKMRRYRIRMAPGDKVKVELSPYDPTRGRIVYRER